MKSVWFGHANMEKGCAVISHRISHPGCLHEISVTVVFPQPMLSAFLSEYLMIQQEIRIVLFPCFLCFPCRNQLLPSLSGCFNFKSKCVPYTKLSAFPAPGGPAPKVVVAIPLRVVQAGMSIQNVSQVNV